MRKLLFRIAPDKRGVSTLEYALIAALLAVFVIGSVTRFGKAESKTFTTIEKDFKISKAGKLG